jgi:farnesyl-diphosphate farnesyltransferase
MNQVEKNLVRTVSRSFYLSLSILPTPVRSAMALGYVLCRAADTLADEGALASSARLDALEKLESAITTFPLDAKRVANSLPVSYECTADWLNRMSPTERAFIQNVVQGVIKGMRMDLSLFGDSIETVTALKNESDLETYIGRIGGDPGLFWTNLLLHHHLFPSTVDRDALFRHGDAFGRGLQMVNILKDFPEDLKRGRCYIPLERLAKFGLTLDDITSGQKKDVFLTLYRQLIEQTIHRLENGLLYIYELKPLDFRLRAAVWWPLCLGLRTLKHLYELRDVMAPITQRKIKRIDVYRAIASSVPILPWKSALRWEFERLVG